jgi:D-alanyl-D-alanine carboxypeptidase
MKKVLALFMVLLLVFSFSFVSHGTETTQEQETTEHPETTEYVDNPTHEPDIVSDAAIVMDASTGQVLYEKNSEMGKYPASITKIITVLIALEHDVDLDQKVTMSENAIWGIERSSTNIGLDVGEEVTVRDLLYATMVNSANECAYAVAELVAGDVESFAKLMNEKAKELGCKHTHFVTPNGLHDDDHYTTAYDMALITQAAIKNDQFREIAGTVNYTIPPTNLKDEERPLWTGTKMINPASPYYYEDCEGGKNGYTTNANNTLVTFAKKDGLELICVVLDCDGLKYTYTDTRALYNYCYNNFMYFYPISDFSFQKEQNENSENDLLLDNYYKSLNHEMIDLTVDTNYHMLIHKTVDTTKIEKEVKLYDSVSDNSLGEIDFLYEGEIIGKTPITSTTTSLDSQISKSTQKEEKLPFWERHKHFGIILVVIIVSLIIILILAAFINSLIQTKKRNDRRRRYTDFRKNNRRRRRDDHLHF